MTSRTVALFFSLALAGGAAAETRYFDVVAGSGPHDVAAAPG